MFQIFCSDLFLEVILVSDFFFSDLILEVILVSDFFCSDLFLEVILVSDLFFFRSKSNVQVACSLVIKQFTPQVILPLPFPADTHRPTEHWNQNFTKPPQTRALSEAGVSVSTGGGHSAAKNESWQTWKCWNAQRLKKKKLLKKAACTVNVLKWFQQVISASVLFFFLTRYTLSSFFPLFWKRAPQTKCKSTQNNKILEVKKWHRLAQTMQKMLRFICLL